MFMFFLFFNLRLSLIISNFAVAAWDVIAFPFAVLAAMGANFPALFLVGIRRLLSRLLILPPVTSLFMFCRELLQRLN